MVIAAAEHRRVHNGLLLQRLLSLREGVSPFTLILDTLEQSGRPLLRRFLDAAKKANAGVICLASAIPRDRSSSVEYITTWAKDPADVRREVREMMNKLASSSKHIVIFIDSLTFMASDPFPQSIATYLLSLLTPVVTRSASGAVSQTAVSCVATYHTDIMVRRRSPYAPECLTELCNLATATLRVHSFAHVVSRKRATERSLPEPIFGLAEERDGVIFATNGHHKYNQIIADDEHNKGIIVDMSFRRKSGRAVDETFFIPITAGKETNKATKDNPPILASDHPLLSSSTPDDDKHKSGDQSSDLVQSTFSLGLTDKQRQDREAVVLPYFDAQKIGFGDQLASGRDEIANVNTGGRILYDMGVEDDFDDEEDEI